MGNVVLNERRVLSEAGLIIVAATIDIDNKIIVSGPELTSRGFVYVKENEGIMNEAKGKAFASLEYHLQNNKGDWNALKNGLRNDMRKHIFNKTKRSPMILPILMEG